MIHQRRLGPQLLRHCDGLDHGFDFSLQIMALIDHVGDIGGRAGLPFKKADLVKNAEHLVRVDRAQGQIVIGVAAVVEVESAEQIFGKQPCDDLFDVLRRIMMAGVDQDLRLRTCRRG